MPATVFPPTLRQAGGQQVWVPIGSRGRGAPGSGGGYDNVSNSVQDQTVWQAPSFAGVKAIRLAYAGFDITCMGEVDRVAVNGAPQPATTLAASVTTVARSVAQPAATVIASGATSFTVTPSVGGTPWPCVKVGQFITGVAQVPTNTYVTQVATTYSADNSSVTSVTISLSAATTGAIPAGTEITFQGDLMAATFGGLRSSRLECRHGFTFSDPIPMSLSANEMFAVRTFAAFANAGFQTSDYPADVGGTSTRVLPSDNFQQYEFSNRGTGLTDHTLDNSFKSNSGAGYFCPAFILGLVETAPPAAVLLLGDSIGAGTGDIADTLANVKRKGWFQRSLQNKVPWISLARGSTTAFEAYQSGGLGQFAAVVGTGITDVVMQFCNNDLFTTGSTATVLRQQLVSLAARYLAAGLRVWICTALPRTGSADGWASLTGQTFLTGVPNTAAIALASNASAGATTLSVKSIANIAAGQVVSGPGVTGPCSVVSYTSTTVTLSTGLSAAASAGQGFVCCGAEQQRQLYNTDIRANFASYGFAGVVDIASVVESAAQPGFWTPLEGGAATADGVHPSPAAHAAIIAAGVLTPSMFGTIPPTAF